MAGQRPGPAAPVRPWARAAGWRLAAVLVLLVVAALGERARAVTHLSSTGLLDPSKPVMFVFAVALVVLAVLVLGTLFVVLYRLVTQAGPAGTGGARTPAAPVRWWVRLLMALGAVTLVLLPAAIVVILLLDSKRRRPRSPTLGVGSPRPLPTYPSHPGETSAVLLTALGVLVVLAILWLWRHRWRRRPPEAAAPEPPLLSTAVSAGTLALRSPRSPREAIIACYAAMEDSLATAGSPREAADTPEDLLNRAAGEGVVRRPAAERLTALFREARFSPHTLGEAERDDANAALDDISRELADGG
ncbi:MAG TPA: DUF4129 domain-containing protein [Streptosporangiaceae bacterium]|nr:DUF4129 domain-containing protein [Streptosporangiaceae bacterium]